MFIFKHNVFFLIPLHFESNLHFLEVVTLVYINFEFLMFGLIAKTPVGST